MPRAKSDSVKSSAELDAEIKEMQEKIAAKKKAARLAKQKEDQAREYEMNQLNATFVDFCKDIYFEDHRDKTCSVYDLLWPYIASTEPVPMGVLRPHVFVPSARNKAEPD